MLLNGLTRENGERWIVERRKGPQKVSLHVVSVHGMGGREYLLN